ncbi:MAG: hypothetical protein H6559_03185 [Lewinellaceae bacterium]|nr:hypothetical protein [Lewinellaceae bacterium]
MRQQQATLPQFGADQKNIQVGRRFFQIHIRAARFVLFQVVQLHFELVLQVLGLQVVQCLPFYNFLCLFDLLFKNVFLAVFQGSSGDPKFSLRFLLLQGRDGKIILYGLHQVVHHIRQGFFVEGAVWINYPV